MEKSLESGREASAASNLRDVDDFRHQRLEAVGILVDAKETAEHDHHGGQRRLPDVGGAVELAGPRADRHGETELAPQAIAIQPQALQCLRVHPVEQDHLSGGGDHNAPGPDGSVRESGRRVERGKGGKNLEEEAQCGVDSRGRRAFGTGVDAVEEIGQAVAAYEFGDDHDRATSRIAFDASDVRKPLVLERRGVCDAFPNRAVEGAKLGAEMEVFQYAARLAVEHQDPPPEPVLEPGRRQRGGNRAWWHRHVGRNCDAATCAPANMSSAALKNRAFGVRERPGADRSGAGSPECNDSGQFCNCAGLRGR
jgi:hypothetical protein